jgi:hypothetical protein
MQETCSGALYSLPLDGDDMPQDDVLTDEQEVLEDDSELEDEVDLEDDLEDDLEADLDADDLVDEDGDDEVAAPDGETETEALEELEAEELELLEEEAAEALLVDEAAEMRAIQREELTMNLDAQQAQTDEFVCASCFLVKRTSQLANRRKMICTDCAA